MHRALMAAGLALLVSAGPGTAQGMRATTGPRNPDTAPRVRIDRFSERAGHLQVRTPTNGLPGPNQPIDFDRGPFITQGLGPDGRVVRYYNFDIQPTTPAPIYVLFRAGEDRPVEGQLNIVDAVPGDEGYSDFWRVMRVTVPRDYVANTVTSLGEIRRAGYRIHETAMLVNCPIVPEGSTARLRLGDGPRGLQRGWYRGQVVFYFTFEEKVLSVAGQGTVPVSPIYVTFTINPDQPGGGPPSGFVTERDGVQTHNVLQTLPSDAGYSPLWLVAVYHNGDFARVRDLETVTRARILAAGVATVNCPVVDIRPARAGP